LDPRFQNVGNILFRVYNSVNCADSDPPRVESVQPKRDGGAKKKITPRFGVRLPFSGQISRRGT